MKVIKTNWINFLGVFITVLLYVVIGNLSEAVSIGGLLLMALLLIFLYGIIFWIGLFAALITLDLILIRENQRHLLRNLLIEWFIISIPFMYWTAIYEEYIFLPAILSLLVTQILRKQLIVSVCKSSS
ncbi:hypothetical protein [Chitinophaga sp. Cy-1792]|uniref:hypothetical protein n=1 Tax=Chitinophaga sp. Cy-1792 TaxID=2608339 RepID=UPI0014208B4E|nr:hypothetical protein [Chitinophaga sp. Cy-1792]NIG55068.1 hypothetical protein [Chitinophaga sp. Cy-1792]